MLDSFWKKVSEGLAEQINLRIISVTFAFWGGGAFILYLAYGPSLLNKLLELQGLSAWTAVLVIIILLIFSNWLVQRLSYNMLRLFEGYWPWPFTQLRWKLAKAASDAWEREMSDKRSGGYQDLRHRFDSLSPADQERFTLLKMKYIHDFPQTRDLKLETIFMPTQLGNQIRAAEVYSYFHYGLDAVLAWPRIWLVLPEIIQKEITAAWDGMLQQVQLLTWGILFSMWVYWRWWALIISLIIAIYALFELHQAARKYGLLLRSTFDLYRFRLYEQLHLPLPDKFENEREIGKAITRFFLEGKESQVPAFVHPEK